MIRFIIAKIFGIIGNRFYVPEILDLIKELLWPVTVLISVLIFRQEISKLIGRIKNIKYKGMSIETSPGAEKALSTAPKPSQITEDFRGPKTAVAKLAFLLSNYQYVWSAWATRPEYSHAVRFSEKYSGGKLRFIDQYCSDLNNYEKKFENFLSNDIKSKFVDLKGYLESILPYQNIEEELTSPTFSRPKYLEFFGNLAASLEKPTTEIGG